MLMRYDAFSEIFNEEHFKYIEFYGKVMEWHTRWSDEIRQMYHINCSRLPFIPKIKSFLNKL